MPKTKSRFKSSKISRSYLLVFGILFALVGGLVAWKIFAAPNTGILEAEKMKHYSKVRLYGDSLASGKKGIKVDSNAKKASQRRLSGTITTGNLPAYSFAVVAKAYPCHNKWPTFTAKLSGPSNITIKKKVTSLGYHSYGTIGLNAPAKKKYSVNIYYNTTIKYARGKTCKSVLYFDVVRLKPRAAGITNISSEQNGKNGKKGVKIHATIDGHNNPTTYYAEYGTSTDYGYVTKSVTLRASDSSQDVTIVIDQNLLPNTTYHYRVCTAAGDEVNCSGDYTFTTGDTPGDKGTNCWNWKVRHHGNNGADADKNTKKCRELLKKKNKDDGNHTCNNNAEHWDGSACVCNGGQTNPDSCNQCPAGQVYHEPDCVDLKR